MAQNTVSSNSRIVHKKVSLPSGKENIHPSARSTKSNVRSKLRNKSCWESACSSLNGNLKVEAVDSSRAIVGSAIKGTGFPFQVYKDDTNNNVATTLKRCSKVKSMARVSPKDDNNITQTSSRSIGKINELRDNELSLPSKIPLFKCSPRATEDKDKVEGREKLEEDGNTINSQNPMTQINILLPSLMPVKSGRVKSNQSEQKSKVTSNKNQELFTELHYNTQYNEYVLIVEHEREQLSPQLSSKFLTDHINAEQRRLVISFMIHLGTHCLYPSYIIYQSAKLFDVVMDRISVDTTSIQIVALACVWIILKKQENFHKIPTATTMIALAKEMYVGREDLLLTYEKKVLCTVNFNLTFVDAFSLYSYYIINCRRNFDISDETATLLYNYGCYMVIGQLVALLTAKSVALLTRKYRTFDIDITLLDEQFCRKPVNLIVLSIAELVFGLNFDAAIIHARPRWSFWRNLFANVCDYSMCRFPDNEINQMRIAMLRRLLDSGRGLYRFGVVYKKYNRSRQGRISAALLERANNLSISETFDI